ncbi:MAG: polymer-forming cytoskeletal protein [Helicobacteraceae bacterium]|nr:polymer-forming cytoskeletal protein [Helicobacteraceae bacterium]
MAVDTSGTTIVAKGTKITGTIEVECKLHIDGQVDGTVKSSNVVTVGSSGNIKGEVFAEKLVVNGEMNGNADCANIEILANGRMTGDVVSSNLIIEAQAVFEGYSKIRVPDAKPTKSFFAKSEPKELPKEL